MKLILFMSLLLLSACKETCSVRVFSSTEYSSEVESNSWGDWGRVRHVCGKDFKDCNAFCDKINYPETK